eukprot:COSAG04_NODE_24651_length_318_cov_3.876712_1_plen_92_part_10
MQLVRSDRGGLTVNGPRLLHERLPRLRPVPVVTITAEPKVNLYRQAAGQQRELSLCKISKLVLVTSFHSPLVRLAVAPPVTLTKPRNTLKYP